jgi:hypothetical protein
MRTLEPIASQQTPRVALMFGAACLTLFFTFQSQAFPVTQVTFRTDAPFQGVNQTNPAPLTSSDGLLTVAGWADLNAIVPAKLYQWWWIFGVNSGVGNGAYVDGQECMSLQFHPTVGCSMIRFLDTPAGQITVSGFLSDPGAFAIAHLSPLISNLSYANGAVTFDYAGDTGNNYGQLLFANPAASVGQILRVSSTTGAGLYSVDCTEIYGATQVNAGNVRYNLTNAYMTPDGALTVRSFSDLTAQTPANFGTSLDQCFGVYGGANNAGIDGTETVTLQLASGYGLSRLESVYSSPGQVSIYGFASDPGMIDPSGNGYLQGVQYDGNGLLTFYAENSGHVSFFFTNRAASAGRTLRINSDQTVPSYYFGIAGIGYADLHTVFGPDIPAGASSYTTSDGFVTLNPYSDTPGATPASFNETMNGAWDWLGIAGGATSQAIEGTESLSMQFASTVGLSGLGTRYTGGNIIIGGFTSDPGLVGPTGAPISGSTYAGGTLTVPVANAWHASETVVRLTNPGASAGRTLSLHTDGRSGAQITLTQINYAAAPVTLTINKIGDQVVLTWLGGGTLQQSSTVSSGYTDVTGATSPYTSTISGTQQFFRVKVQ